MKKIILLASMAVLLCQPVLAQQTQTCVVVQQHKTLMAQLTLTYTNVTTDNIESVSRPLSDEYTVTSVSCN